MIDPPTTLAIASIGVLVFLCPAMALFFGGIPSRQDARWLVAIGAAAVPIATVEWMLLGQPPSLAIFEATIAAVAVLSIAAIGLRGARRASIALTLAIWLTVVLVPVGNALFDIENGMIVARLGTLDFAGAGVVAIVPGTAAIAISLAHRWSGVVIEGQPRRPRWLFVYCAIAGILGFLAVAVGAELVIDDTTGILALNTALGAAGGVIGWTAAQIANVHRASVAGVVAGAMAGGVVVLPASPWLEPVAVVVLAIIASILGHITAIALRRRETTQAWASLTGIMLVPGIVGFVGAGVVAAGPGLLYSGHADLAEAQLSGLAIVLVLSFAVTLIIAAAVFVLGGRVVSASQR